MSLRGNYDKDPWVVLNKADQMETQAGTVLCCAVLVLYCTVLYCTVLYCHGFE